MSAEDKTEARGAYWRMVRDVAAEAKAEEDPDLYIYEAAEGWLITKADALEVMAFTDNDDALWDAGASLDGCSDWGHVVERVATYALIADLQSRLHSEDT